MRLIPLLPSAGFGFSCDCGHGLRGLAAQRLALVEQVGGAGVECAIVLACQVDLGSVTLTTPIFADE